MMDIEKTEYFNTGNIGNTKKNSLDILNLSAVIRIWLFDKF